MASLPMFTATANIKKAVGLINDLDGGKFPRLLSRILQKLHLKDERTFSAEEEEKLEGALGLSGADLGLVLEACEFFVHQAAYHSAKPNTLGQQLVQIGLDEDKAKTLVDAWSSSARGVIEKLRKRTLAPKQLETVNWRLNLGMSQASQSKMKEPNALLELGLHDDDTGNKEKIRMEFNHEELYKFYNKLEAIQGQLDSLG